MSKFTLTDYAIFSAVFLQTQNLQAEVIHVDIEPDVVLDDDGELYLLDFDQDGNNDFRFVHDQGGYAPDYGSVNFYFDRVFAGVVNYNNWIAGTYFTEGSVMYSSFMTYRPYMIPFAYPIGVMLSFQDGYAQLAAEFVVDSAGEFYNEEGKWGAGGEAFFGIRTKRDEHYYYGWIRATVADSAKSITLHDYAYETIADKTIIAGDSLGTMSVSTSSLQPININCNGTTLFIQTNESYNINQTELIIYDLSGKQVFSKQLSAGNQLIQLPLQTGIYIATCNYNGDIISKTISIL